MGFPFSSLTALVLSAGLCTVSLSSQAQSVDSTTLRRIQQTGVISIGHRVASVPFSYLDSRRRPIGYTIDVCQRVVDAVRERLQMPSLEVRYVGVTAATRLPMLASGAIDLECGVTTNTVERQRFAAFSLTTFVAASRMLSRKAAQLTSVDDLRGRTVVSTVATTSMQYLASLNQAAKLDMRILGGQDDADAMRILRNGQAVAFVMDDVLLRSLLAGARDADDFDIGSDALSVEPYAIGLPRNDAAFKQLVDGVILDIFKRGDLHTLHKRWFQSPIPPRGINLQIPMSDQLQRLIRQPIDSPDPQNYR